MIKLNRVCGYCGGDGRLSDGSTYCPHCNTHAKDIPVSIYEIPSREFSPYMEVMASKKPFNLAEFDAYYRHLKTASEYIKFRNQIYQIVSQVLKGEPTTTSYLIYMDNNDFIDRFTSTYLCTAYKAGLSIFPFLDTSTLWQMKTNRNFKLPEDMYGDINFYDAINSDILCINLVTQMDLFASAGIAYYLVTTRGRLNKPTLIFTTMSGSELFRKDLLTRVPHLKDFRGLVKSQKDSNNTCSDVVYAGLNSCHKK